MTSYPEQNPQIKRPGWDEIIPGLDPKIKRMYDDWDEVVDGDKEVPLCGLFDPPLKLEPPDQIASEEDAKSLLEALLDQLDVHNVAIHVCDHFSALDTYRWLVEEILPEATIHPELPRIGFIENFTNYETCQKCAAEFDC